MYRAIVKLSYDDYFEANFPCDTAGIVLPCRHIGCDTADAHDLGLENSDVNRTLFRTLLSDGGEDGDSLAASKSSLQILQSRR